MNYDNAATSAQNVHLSEGGRIRGFGISPRIRTFNFTRKAIAGQIDRFNKTYIESLFIFIWFWLSLPFRIAGFIISLGRSVNGSPHQSRGFSTKQHIKIIAVVLFISFIWFKGSELTTDIPSIISPSPTRSVLPAALPLERKVITPIPQEPKTRGTGRNSNNVVERIKAREGGRL